MLPYRKKALRIIEAQKLQIKELSEGNLRKELKEEFRQREIAYQRKLNKAYAAKVALHAGRTADRRLERRKLNRTSYFDGIFNYMAIVAFAKERDVNATEMAYLILINLVPKLLARDCAHFGFDQMETSRKNLESLVAKGYCERFTIRNRVPYTASMKGDRLVLDFKNHYRKILKTLQDNDEYKRKSIRWED